MHNLHLIRVKADTPEEACSAVETDIEDYGTENNWRTICGCLSTDNVAHDKHEGGRWKPSSDGYNTIEALNDIVTGWMQPSSYRAELIEKIDSGEVKLSEITDRMDLYAVKKFVTELSMVIDVGVKAEEFNILEHTFFDYEYSECGVTECYGDGENTYIVFVDMHD